VKATDNSVREEEKTPLVLQSSDHEEGKKEMYVCLLRSIWIYPEKEESQSSDELLSDHDIESDDNDIRLLPEDYEITEKIEMVTLLEIHNYKR
jgi:hypothetical protein